MTAIDQPLPRVLRILRWLQWVSLGVVILSGSAWWATQNGWAPLLAVGDRFSTDFGLEGSSAESRPEQRVAAPRFELALFDGGTLGLAELRGRGVVLNFWASWCVPCREEAPLLARTWEANRGRGITVVGVDVWDTEPEARAFIAEFGVTYPNGPDGQAQIGTEYGIPGVPTTIFLDPQGRIARRWVGALVEQRLPGFVDEVLP